MSSVEYSYCLEEDEAETMEPTMSKRMPRRMPPSSLGIGRRLKMNNDKVMM